MAAAAAAAYALKLGGAGYGPRLVTGPAVLAALAALYGVGTLALGVPEARALVQRVRRRK